MRIALALVLVGTLAACGSSPSGGTSKSAYGKRLAALVPETQAAVLKGRFALESVRVPAVGRRQLNRIESRLRATIAALKAITPPKDVAAEHERLIAAYGAVLAEFSGLDAAARAATTDKLRVAAGRLESAPAAMEVAGALQAIIAKGYDLGFPKS